MIIKLTLTKVSTIVRDSETRKPEGINQYCFAGKLSKADVVEILNSTTAFEPNNAPDKEHGTVETIDSVAHEKVEVEISNSVLARDAGIATGILSGPYTPIPYADTDSVKEAE